MKSDRVDEATGQRVFVSPLTGSYQLHNIATLFQALELLPSLGYPITMDQVANGIARVVEDTGLHGRWEKMDMHPLTICETAHNGDGVEAMLHKLKGMPYSHLHLVYGVHNLYEHCEWTLQDLLGIRSYRTKIEIEYYNRI